MYGITNTIRDRGLSNICASLGCHVYSRVTCSFHPHLSAVTPCLESVPASQAGRDSTVMRRVLLDSMGKLANRSAAARTGLTVTVWQESVSVPQDSKWVAWAPSTEGGAEGCSLEHTSTSIYMTFLWSPGNVLKTIRIINKEENKEKKIIRDISNYLRMMPGQDGETLKGH